MTGIAFNEPFCRILTVALMHSLWQGLLLGIAGAAAGRLMQHRSPKHRHAILLVLQSMLLVSFVGTAYWAAKPAKIPVPPTVASIRPVAESASRAAEVISPILAPAVPVTAGPVYMSWQKPVAVGYLLCVAAMLLRLIVGLWGGKRMIRASSPIVQAHVLMAIARAVKAMEFGYTPAVAYCNSVVVPSVVGVLRPTLLLPLTVLSGLTPQQIEVLVMHELAHIGRCDHLFNLWQRLLESFFFYHPATWYLSLRIRAERELCCDDCVLAAGGQAEQYAKSLLRMAEISISDPLTNVKLVALAATGRRSELRSRIIRILEGETSSKVRLKRIGAAAVTAILIVCMIAPLAFAFRVGSSTERISGDDTIPIKSNYRQIAPAEWPGFHAAVAYATLPEIQALLDGGADPDGRDSLGWTPLFYAIRFQRVDVIACLLKARANVNAQGAEGCTPLHASLGVGPNLKGPSKFSLRLDVIKMLLSAGANPNIQWDNGFTALHQAVSTRNADAVIAILEGGGDITKRNADGRTPLTYAASLVPCNPDILRVLISRGSDAHDLDPNGWSLIDVLCKAARDGADGSRSRFDEAARLLLDAGAEPGLLSKVVLGMDRELAASIEADPEIVNRQMERTVQDNRMIHWAAMFGSPATCKLLIDAGADTNILTSVGDTALGFAAARHTNAAEIVRLLLAAGAQVNPKETRARLPIFSAIEGIDPAPLRLLLDAGAQVNRIQQGSTLLNRLANMERYAVGASRLPMAEMLITAGIDINARDRTDATAMHSAVQASRLELVRLLLQHHAEVDAVDKSGRTPLMLAAVAEPTNLPILRELLNAKADPNIADSGGRTAAALLRANRDPAVAALGASLK